MTTEFTITGLKSATLEQKRDALNLIKEYIKEEIAYNKQQKESIKIFKAAQREEKKALKIAQLQAKIDALKNPVGSKAIKANKKPSACTVTTFA